MICKRMHSPFENRVRGSMGACLAHACLSSAYGRSQRLSLMPVPVDVPAAHTDPMAIRSVLRASLTHASTPKERT